MKKILVSLFLISIITNFSYAENLFAEDDELVHSLEGFIEYNEMREDADAIYLDLETKKSINFTPAKSFSYDSSKFNRNTNLNIFNSSNLESASKFSSQEYMISPMSQSLYRKNGKFTFGTYYGSYLDTAEINYETAIFSRYDSKKFAITTAFAKNTGNDYSYYKDKVYIIPELKLTKRLSLVNSFEADTDMASSKNEIMLKYSPKFKSKNDLSFEFGAGQTYNNNEYAKSSLKFSTKFRF